MKIKHTLSITFLFTTYFYCTARQPALDTPQVGKQMPEFVLNNVTHFKKKEASLNDFKGKWLFMDFWSTGCTSCIKSFHKVNDITKTYQDKINWLMVGINSSINNKDTKTIETVYERLSEMQELKMISAYDSALSQKWDIHSVPHIFIIDPNGILKFITDGRDLTKEKVNELLDGKHISLFDKAKAEHLNFFDPTTINSNSNPNGIIYSSSVSKWNGEKQSIYYEIDQYIKAQDDKAYKNGFSMVMAPLYMLYNMAYFGKSYLTNPYDSLYGKVYPTPILEMKDSSVFEFDFTTNLVKGTYNYNVLIPNKTISKEKFLMLMQQDITRTFNYTANIETRSMPIWKLKANSADKAKLKTKSGEPYNSARKEPMAAGFTLKNKPVKEFLITLTHYLSEKTKHTFLDDTGIKDNIDISISADLTDFKKTIEALRKLGLDLVFDKTEMQVLVIKDNE